MPSVQQLVDDLAGRDDVVVLALAGNDAPEDVRPYWDEQGFTFDAVTTRRRAANAAAHGVVQFPVSIVVGPEGDVLHAGYAFDEAVIRELLDA